MPTVSLRSLTTTWAAGLVAAFDASGVHRVGTPGDLASGAWLAAEATQSGVAIARLPVPIQYTCGSCTSIVRVNTRGLPGNRHKGKKA
jgi:hypothetical protein